MISPATHAKFDASLQVGSDAWAQMHNGREVLLRPEQPRSEIYESVWQAAQAQSVRRSLAPPIAQAVQLPSSSIPTVTIPTSPPLSRRESAGIPTIADGPAAAAAVVDMAQQMRLWTPEQIEAFARGLVRG